MNKFDSKWVKWIGGGIGAIVAGIVLMVGATKIVYPAISELVGLSVASSSTSWNSVIDAAQGDSITTGILGQSPYLWNGVSFDRQRGSITNGGLVDVTRLNGTITAADTYANPTTLVQALDLPLVFNGTTWDRQRSASGANNTAVTSLGAQQVTPLSTWSVTNTPAVTTIATASKALGGGTVRHVATGVTICIANPVAVVSGPLTVNLRDGASGAGTIIRSWAYSAIANDSKCTDLSGLNMTGTANTAMTLEFVAAGGAGSQETVTLTGYSIP